MVLLIPVLAVVLWLLVREPMQPHSAAAAEEVTAPTESGTVDASETEYLGIEWEIPPLYQSSGRDPMQLAPPETEAGPARVTQTYERFNLPLRGILYSEDRPVAMIGTSLAHEGQQIDGVTIVEITRESVEFEANGQRWTQTISDLAIPSRRDNTENRKQPSTGP
jgi:hypothetical protein